MFSTKRIQRLTIVIIISFFAFHTENSQGQLFGANNYEDCLLKNIKSNASSRVVETIKRACRGKFPIKAPKPKKINNIVETSA